MSQQNINQIDKILANFVSTINQQQKKEVLGELVENIKQQYNTLDIYEKDYERNQNKIKNCMRLISSQIKSNQKRRQQALREIEKLDGNFREEHRKVINELHQSGIAAYESLMNVREAFTEQQNNYNFLLKNKKRLGSVKMKYEDLMNTTTINNSKNRQAVIRFVNNIEEQIQIDKDQVSLMDFSDASTTYSAVYRYYCDHRLTNGKTGLKKEEFGIFYQAYEDINERHGGKNNYIPSNYEMEETFARVRSGSGTSGAFYHGPDTLAQDKAWGGKGAPSLTSIPTIINGLKQLEKALNTFIDTDDTKKIQKMFSNKKVGQNTFDILVDESIENIRKNFGIIK